MSSTRSVGRLLHGRVLAAFVSIGLWSVFVRVGQASKDLLVAHDFGTRSVLDAFLVAFIVPSFITFGVAAPVGDALLPTFIAASERDRALAQRTLSSVLAISVAAMAMVAIVAAAAVHPLLKLVGSGLAPATLALAARFFLLMLPTVVLSGLTAPLVAVLNAGGRYRTTVLTPLFAPLITIALLVVAHATLGGYALVIGVVAGALVEVGVLAAAVRRLGWSVRPRHERTGPELRHVLSQYAPLVAGSLLLTGTTIIDQSMAAMLGPHNVSALNYANKVVLALLSVANLAVGTPIMTNISQLVAASEWTVIRSSFRLYAIWLTALTIPATMLLVWLSPRIVSLLFEHGSFSAADARLVDQVQQCYLLQIPFHLLGVLAVRFIMAMSYNRALTYIAIVQLIVNVVANLLLMRILGLAGIALSTAVVFAISMLLAVFVLVKLLRERTVQV